MKLDREHIAHYLYIAGYIALGLIVANKAPGKNEQMLVVIVFSLLYAMYGIIHHGLEHDLTIKIVVEYVLVALLAIALFFFVLEGS